MNHIFKSSFDQLCIVGMEPLADTRSVVKIKEIVSSAEQNNTQVSIITNGLNGRLLDVDTIKKLAWIDISIDADAGSYSSYRKGSWAKLLRSIDHFKSSGVASWRALHNISDANAHLVPDMIQMSRELGFDRIVFSPYLKTKSMGVQTVNMVPPEKLLKLFESHMAADVFLLLDTAYADAFNCTAEEIVSEYDKLGSNFLFVDGDPVNRGLLRVTYDGLVMTAKEAIHTAEYKNVGRELSRTVTRKCVYAYAQSPIPNNALD